MIRRVTLTLSLFALGLSAQAQAATFMDADWATAACEAWNLSLIHI